METLKDLMKVIYLKKGGYDCTESESAVIKSILKALITNFQIEFNESVEESMQSTDNSKV